MQQLFEFLGLAPKNVTLVRLLVGESGSTTEVACGATPEALAKLLAAAEREPYHDRTVGWVKYVGTYLRPSHDVEPRDWLASRPKLTAETASRYVCFVIDVDAVKAGDSATDAELAEARACAEEVLSWLSEHINLSAVRGIMSGNGYQLVVRGHLELDHQWLVAELLVRAEQRWPMIDLAGYKTTIGPAVPQTRKCKGVATDDAPHRMVAVEWETPGDYWVTPDDLVALIQSLPPAADSGAKPARREPTVVLDEWQAVSTLPISDVLHRLFGAECCPICKSDDSAFAVLAENVCVCLHGRRCAAAASGHRGFTAAHAYGYKLFDKWRDFTPAERAEIVCAARDDGFEIAIDPELARIRQPPPPAAVAAWDSFLARRRPEPSQHRSIRPKQRWILHGPSYQEASEHLRQEIIAAYCPDWAVDHNDARDAQPLVFDGATLAYHQDLGVFVPALRRSGDATEDGALARIIADVAKHGILYSDAGGKPHTFTPNTMSLLKEFERYTKNVGYMQRGPAGIACRDGFLALEGSKLVERPHSPANRARGRLRMLMADARVDNHYVRAATEAFLGIVRKLLWHITAKECSKIAMAILQQVGAALCRLRPEVRRGVIFHGPPDVGKSTIIRIMRAMFERIGLAVASCSIADINHEYPPPVLATAVANLVDELDSLVVERTARLKHLSEGTPWCMNRKNLDQLTVTNSLFQMYGVNGDVRFREASGALVKRFMVIEFPNMPVPKDKREPLAERFVDTHLDGLALAAVLVSLELSVTGRTELPTDQVARDTEAMMRETDPVAAWFEARAQLSAVETARDDLHLDCLSWMRAHGYERQAQSLQPGHFSAGLKRLPGVTARRSNSRWLFNVATATLPPTSPDPRSDRL